MRLELLELLGTIWTHEATTLYKRYSHDQIWKARIKSIDLYEVHAPVGDPISVKSIWTNLRDRCVFDLDNNHWVYGYQIEEK